MKKIFKFLYFISSQLIHTLVSIISVIFFSRPIKKIQYLLNGKNIDFTKILILGNGPSLRKSIDLDSSYFSENELMVVNNFCESDLFWSLRPKFYILIDPIYFREQTEPFYQEEVDKFINLIINIDWEIFMFVPVEFKKSDTRRKIKNKNITFIYINVVPVDGFKSVRHFIYKMNMGMPRPQNVLNAAIFTAINIGFHTIELYGADHSWSIDVRVNDKNEPCIVDGHFYDKNHNLRVLPGFTIGSLFEAFSLLFQSHKILAEYAQDCNVNIINCTPNSFIDAYTRKRL